MRRRRIRPPEVILKLPKCAVIFDQEACPTYMGIDSTDTLRRLEKKGDAPPRTQLSQRIYGRTVGAWEQWIAARTVSS
jgi:hypothetical protein